MPFLNKSSSSPYIESKLRNWKSIEKLKWNKYTANWANRKTDDILNYFKLFSFIYAKRTWVKTTKRHNSIYLFRSDLKCQTAKETRNDQDSNSQVGFLCNNRQRASTGTNNGLKSRLDMKENSKCTTISLPTSTWSHCFRVSWALKPQIQQVYIATIRENFRLSQHRLSQRPVHPSFRLAFLKVDGQKFVDKTQNLTIAKLNYDQTPVFRL